MSKCKQFNLFKKLRDSYEFFSFLDFMSEWNRERRPEFMDVAWTTEKSIEDELDRTSKAEVITVIISYLVMFVYIAFALGKIRTSFVDCVVSFIDLTITQNYGSYKSYVNLYVTFVLFRLRAKL